MVLRILNFVQRIRIVIVKECEVKQRSDMIGVILGGLETVALNLLK